MTDARPGDGALEIREATDADWPLIWPIFRATVRAGETYAFDPDMTRTRPARSGWSGRPGRTVVAVVGRRGARHGEDGPEPRRPRGARRHGQLHGRARPRAAAASGRALATYVVDWHRAQGYRGIQFNAVVETNTAAVALWQVARLHDRRHRARGVRPPGARVRRPARHAPAAGLSGPIGAARRTAVTETARWALPWRHPALGDAARPRRPLPGGG